MRPKKKVLIYGTDEAGVSEIGYVLWTRALTPLVAASEAGAIQTARSVEIDCAVVLCRVGRAQCEQLVEALNHARPGMPVLLVLPAASAQPSRATMVLPRFDTALMLEAIRTLTTRRRGPKPTKMVYRGNVDLVSSNLQRVG